MDINRMLKTVKEHPDSSKMGMIASHMGLVRETSLNGDPVKGINVQFDREAIDAIIRDSKKIPGIIEVLVETCDGRLDVGDEIMAVVVGGDIRDRVFPALIATVDRIKKEGSRKKEAF
ncbi:MAG: molybdenum cofactor biosynthesis protein MoaE [Deltaproteobacteria bacterium]|nr:molybdenum cofactor biosynthesis protein MoaE [Deltaproteobacteria bacterium]